MALDGGGGVAEGLGNDRYGCELRELMKRAESRRPSAENVLEAVTQVAGVDVAARAGLVGRGAQCRSCPRGQ